MSKDAQKHSLQAIRSQMSPTRLGDWVLHPDLGVLRCGSEEIRLGSKPLNVLLVLLDAGDRAVSREEVLNRVWGDQYPTDSVVSRAIADLRAALGESAGEQRYIRTVPKFGYQWVAPTGVVSAQDEPAAVEIRRMPALLMALSLTLLIAAAWLVSNWQRENIDLPGSSSVLSLPGPRPLTSAPGIERQPRISPAGDSVVYAALRPGGEDWDLFRTAAGDGTSQPVAVTAGVHEHGPAIHPDGKRLAYVQLSSQECNVVIQSLVLGVPEPLTPCTMKFPTLVDWSPDGTTLAFTAAQKDDESGRRHLHAFNMLNNERQALTHGVSATGTDFYPRYSPSGKQLAFLRGEPQPDHRSSLWLLDLPSGTEIRVTEQPALVAGMTWLDDNRLLYGYGDGGEVQGRILDLSAGETQRIEPSGLLHPEYSVSTDLLVASVSRAERDLYLLDSTGSGRYLAQSTGDEHHARLSPDEKLVAFISQRSGNLELWVSDVETGTTRRLTRFEGLPVRYPDWHPDGQSLLFTVQNEGRERLATVSLLTGEVQINDDPHETATTPRWMPDGLHWIYGCRDNDSWGICLGSADFSRRILDDAFRPVPLDSNSVAAVNSQSQLLRIPLDESPNEILVDQLPASGRYGWTIVEHNLIYAGIDPENSASTIYMLDMQEGTTRSIFSGSIPMADTIISIGSITGSVLFSRYQDASDDVVGFENVFQPRD